MFVLRAHTIAQSTDGSNVTSPPIDTTYCDFVGVFVANFSNDILLTDSVSNVWSKISGDNQAGRIAQIQWSRLTATSPTHTFSWAGSGNSPAIGVMAFSGSNFNPAGVGTSAHSGSVGTQACGLITPDFASSLILAAVQTEDAGLTASIDNGFVITDQASKTANGYGLAFAYKIITAPVNPTWTYSGSASISNAMIQAFSPLHSNLGGYRPIAVGSGMSRSESAT